MSNDIKCKVGDKIEFVESDGFVYFYMIIKKIDETYVSVDVYEVSTWDAKDNSYMDYESDLYLTVMVKWDGCSHVHFSEEGYKHLCGKRCWDLHCDMMNKLYDTCSKMIAGYDASVAE